MLSRFYRQNKSVLDKTIFVLVFMLAVYIFVKFLFPYVAPFVVAFLISLALAPLAGLIRKKTKIPKGVITLVLVVLLVLLMITAGTAIIMKIVSETRNFVGNISFYAEQATVGLNDLQDRYQNFLSFIPGEFSDSLETILLDWAKSASSGIGSGVGAGGINIVRGFPMILMSVIMTILSTYFFTRDSESISGFVSKNFPRWLRGNLVQVRRGLADTVWGYIRAQLIMMSIVGSICILGLSILRFPYAFLIGIVIALIDALPIFGSGAVLWPIAAVSAITGDYRQAVGMMIIYGVILLTRQFLEPRVIGKQIGIHPLLTLIAIFVGLKVFGFIGFIIGPFIMVVSKIVVAAKNPQDDE